MVIPGCTSSTAAAAAASRALAWGSPTIAASHAPTGLATTRRTLHLAAAAVLIGFGLFRFLKPRPSALATAPGSWSSRC
jgi:precorrin-2 methylase